MKRNGIVSLSEGPNIWAKLINYHYGLLMVTIKHFVDYELILILYSRV